MSKQPKRAVADDFWAILPEGKFMHVPTRQLFEAAVVDKLCGKKTSDLLIQERGCSQLTWAPGEPMIITGKVCLKGSWCNAPGQTVFNWYMPPDTAAGDPNNVGPWLELAFRMFGSEAEHMIDWFSHRVQHPDVKINHGLVLGSDAHGIGKDTFLHPVGQAIGRHNWRNISAGRAFTQADQFNAFLENVIVKISEAHDLGEKRFAFYDRMKDWCAAPPETLEVADKNVKSHPIANVVGPVITTNHKDGLYIPPEDRRLYVLWSDRVPSDFGEVYWNRLWHWYDKEGGCENVAAYLATRDLSLFDPKAPPPKTAAWHAIVALGAEPQDAELLDALDDMGDMSWIGEPDIGERPQAISVSTVAAAASRTHRTDLYNFLTDSRNARKISHRFERAGYTTVNNPDVDKGWWRIGGARQMVYADKSLPAAQRHAAVAAFVKDQNRIATRRKARSAETIGRAAQ